MPTLLDQPAAGLQSMLDLARRAAELTPNTADAQACLGDTFLALRSYDDAVTCYEAAIELRPDWPEAHNNLGTALRALERYDDAVRRYETALLLRPEYPEALNNLGSVLFAVHHYEAAMAYYQAALSIDPNLVTARTNLGSCLAELGRFEEALAEHQAALGLEPDNPQVHQALAILRLRRGELDAARIHGRRGFGSGIEKHPFRGAGQPVSILVLSSALGGGVRLDPWLDDHVFAKSVATMEFWDEQAELPPHDFVINTIGEADRCAYALEAASRLVERTAKPVLNQPSKVLATARVENAVRLGELPGVVAPKVELRRREFLSPAALGEAGFGWPLLLRSPGYHTGEHFEKVDTADQLAGLVAGLPGDDLLVIQYLDTYNADGNVRKYRVLIVDGRFYPLHLAVAKHWKVHFMTADMTDYAEHRQEDARFLEDMPGALGPKVMAALERVRDALGLDYGGIDFGVDSKGQLVVWEANATMVAPAPADDPRWDYRRPAIERAHAAVRDMLLSRAQPAPVVEAI